MPRWQAALPLPVETAQTILAQLATTVHWLTWQQLRPEPWGHEAPGVRCRCGAVVYPGVACPGPWAATPAAAPKAEPSSGERGATPPERDAEPEAAAPKPSEAEGALEAAAPEVAARAKKLGPRRQRGGRAGGQAGSGARFFPHWADEHSDDSAPSAAELAAAPPWPSSRPRRPPRTSPSRRLEGPALARVARRGVLPGDESHLGSGALCGRLAARSSSLRTPRAWWS